VRNRASLIGLWLNRPAARPEPTPPV
jgi:hypothetical protein